MKRFIRSAVFCVTVQTLNWGLQEPDRWRCSFRSDGKWLDVNELITPFGGGGHAGAAGLRKRTGDMEELRSQILERVKKLRAEKCFT